MVEKIIVGRNRPDMKLFGEKGTVLLGKHIVGEGDEAHLTNPVYMDVVRPHILLVCGKRGMGKCVEENTLIPLDDGRLVPIKTLENENNQVLGLNHDIKSTTLKRTEFYKRTVNKIVHMKTRSGREIKLTPEHPLLTIKGWKEVRELGIGSRIATPRTLGCFGKKAMEEYKVKLLAYLLAEGHMRNNFVLFSNSDSKILDDFSESVRLFDDNIQIKEHSRPGCYRLVKKIRKHDHSGVIRDSQGRFAKGSVTKQLRSSISIWLREIGVFGKLSKDRILPDFVFQFPKESLCLFLNRLFSCDGSIYRCKTTHGYFWEVSYSTSSKEFAMQISHLLLRFGILSKIRKKITRFNRKDFESYELTIRTDNAIRFVKNIGFFGKKEERIKHLLAHYRKKIRNPNVDTIPMEIWDTYRPQNWAEIGRTLNYVYPKSLRESIKYSPSRQKLAQIALLDKNEVIHKIATSDIFWDEIVYLEELEGKFKVCDITVPGLHNFVANDIFVHNSYSAGVIAEEMTFLPQDIKKNLSVLMIDTMGIYWSMKKPNDKEIDLLAEWGLKPRPMNMQFFIPKGFAERYKQTGIGYDFLFTLPCGEISATDWIITFGFSPMDDYGLLTERAIKSVKKMYGESYAIQDIIKAVGDDPKAEKKVKEAVSSRFSSAEGWGIFEKEGTPVEQFFSPGRISVIDVSHYVRSGLGWSVRSMVIGLFARKVFQARLMARKAEEMETITGEKKKRIPMVWMMVDEAHQFVAAEGKTAATEPMLTLVKEGREPGISLLLITQIPNKLHPDALAQSDLVIAHRLTAESDLKALGAIMQNYAREDLETYLNNLPRTKGAAIVMDDNSERIFPIQVRPRLSWHAGGSPKAIKEKGLFDDV